MFSQIWNYMLFPAFASMGSMGVLYIIHPESAKNICSYIIWHGVNLYSKANIILEQIVQVETNDENLTKEVIAELSYYNCDNKLQISMGSIPPLPGKWWNKFREKVDLLILKNKNSNEKQYKIFKNYKDLQYDDNEWLPVEKPFIQVEFEQKNLEPISIHNNLQPFYIKGNKILGKIFLTWYMKKWYNITLEDTYKLKIFDKNVELFEINESKHVCIETNGYCILSNENKQYNDESTDEESVDEESVDEESVDDESLDGESLDGESTDV